MSGDVESSYYAHMAFDSAHLRRVRSYYAPLFDGHGPVLEIGCGQGEFLDVLRDRGIDGRGVDSDAGMVARASARGHQVVEADAAEYLTSTPRPGPFGGVFCAHLLEHLDAPAAFALVRAAAEVVTPGGVLVFVVPNPASYAVLTHDFWRDPTHVRFYDGPLVEFLCARAGLVVTEAGPNPVDHPGPPPGFDAHLGVDDEPALDGAAVGDGPLAGVVVELSRRLRETRAALRELERAHRTLVWGLYEPNEIFVVARKPTAHS